MTEMRPALMRDWRDIFQNWEALCSSFPRFIPSVISVFVNATTVDGLIRIVFHEPVSTGKALLTMILGRISDIGGTIRLPTCWRS